MPSAGTFAKICCGLVAVSAVIVIGCDIGLVKKSEDTMRTFAGVYSGCLAFVAAIVGFIFVNKKKSGP